MERLSGMNTESKIEDVRVGDYFIFKNAWAESKRSIQKVTSISNDFGACRIHYANLEGVKGSLRHGTFNWALKYSYMQIIPKEIVDSEFIKLMGEMIWD